MSIPYDRLVKSANHEFLPMPEKGNLQHLASLAKAITNKIEKEQLFFSFTGNRGFLVQLDAPGITSWATILATLPKHISCVLANLAATQRNRGAKRILIFWQIRKKENPVLLAAIGNPKEESHFVTVIGSTKIYEDGDCILEP